jgi:2-(1,2-epoxy-1,2-dihydrophenyl)acetyl-CoA isomerase
MIGLSKAKELSHTARRVSAEETEKLGLFNEIFHKETFREDAFTYAREIANGPSVTLSRMKTNLNQGVNQDLKASLLLEAQHLVDGVGSVESKEAISAFFERRTPKFHP